MLNHYSIFRKHLSVNSLNLILCFRFSKMVFLLLFNAWLHQFVINIGGVKYQLLRHQKLRLYPRIDCFLCGHTVVLHKTKCRKRGSTQNAHPRYGFRANIRFEQKIQSYCNATSENRKNELSERQSKKH